MTTFESDKQSHIMPAAGSVTINIEVKDGSVQILKEGPEFQVGKVIDATSMNATTIKEFFARTAMKRSWQFLFTRTPP